MRNLRLWVLAASLLVAAFIAYFVVIARPWAQFFVPGQGMVGGGGGPAAGGGGGAAAGGAGGGALNWSEAASPGSQRMSYAEFLVQENLPPAPIPHLYLMDKDGQVVKNTRNGWYQIQGIYASVGKPPKPILGNPGAAFVRDIQTQISVKAREQAIMQTLYQAMPNGFWFEIGRPRMAGGNGGGGTVTVDVIMHVKESLQKSYGARMQRLLSPYDNPGTDRSRFGFLTYNRGYFNPVVLRISNDAINTWNGLWSGTQVRLRLFGPRGEVITEGIASAGFSGTTCNDLVHPPEMTYAPWYRYLYPDEDRKWTGGKLDLNYKRGWHYQFSFTLSLEQLGRLNSADATLIGTGNIVGSNSKSGYPSIKVNENE